MKEEICIKVSLFCLHPSAFDSSPWWNGDHASVRSSRSRFNSWRGPYGVKSAEDWVPSLECQTQSTTPGPLHCPSPRECEGQHGTLSRC